jgi:hypothetical protein
MYWSACRGRTVVDAASAACAAELFRCALYSRDPLGLTNRSKSSNRGGSTCHLAHRAIRRAIACLLPRGLPQVSSQALRALRIAVRLVVPEPPPCRTADLLCSFDGANSLTSSSTDSSSGVLEALELGPPEVSALFTAEAYDTAVVVVGLDELF